MPNYDKAAKEILIRMRDSKLSYMRWLNCYYNASKKNNIHFQITRNKFWKKMVA